MEVNANNKNKLKITVATCHRLAESVYYLNFLELNQQTINLPDIQYQSVIQVDAKYLQKQIKDINHLDAKHVDIYTCIW